MDVRMLKLQCHHNSGVHHQNALCNTDPGVQPLAHSFSQKRLCRLESALREWDCCCGHPRGLCAPVAIMLLKAPALKVLKKEILVPLESVGKPTHPSTQCDVCSGGWCQEIGQCICGTLSFGAFFWPSFWRGKVCGQERPPKELCQVWCGTLQRVQLNPTQQHAPCNWRQSWQTMRKKFHTFLVLKMKDDSKDKRKPTVTVLAQFQQWMHVVAWQQDRETMGPEMAVNDATFSDNIIDNFNSREKQQAIGHVKQTWIRVLPQMTLLQSEQEEMWCQGLHSAVFSQLTKTFFVAFFANKAGSDSCPRKKHVTGCVDCTQLALICTSVVKTALLFAFWSCVSFICYGRHQVTVLLHNSRKLGSFDTAKQDQSLQCNQQCFECSHWVHVALVLPSPKPWCWSPIFSREKWEKVVWRFWTAEHTTFERSTIASANFQN